MPTFVCRNTTRKLLQLTLTLNTLHQCSMKRVNQFFIINSDFTFKNSIISNVTRVIVFWSKILKRRPIRNLFVTSEY